MRSILFIIGCFLSASAIANSTNEIFDNYRGQGNFAIYMCKMRFELATVLASNGAPPDENSDYVGCIKDAIAEAKIRLKETLPKVTSSKAQEALKAHHVALVTTLEGIKPGQDERVISYEVRQQHLEEKLTEAWARFDVEN